jgi:hypothetical protein
MVHEEIRATNRVFEEEVVGHRDFGASSGYTRARPASCRPVRPP